MCPLNSPVSDYNENISIIWENVKLSFRICLGVMNSYYKMRKCVQIWTRTHRKRNGSRMRGVRHHVTGGEAILRSAPDLHHHRPLILASDKPHPARHWVLLSCYLPRGHPPSKPTSSNFRCKVPAWGPSCKVWCFSIWNKNKNKNKQKTQARKTESYHVSACLGKIWP